MAEGVNDEREYGEGLDPFASHLSFLQAHRDRLGSTFADRITILPLQPPPNRLESFLDFEALEAIASWQGLFKAPRDKTRGELDPEVEGQMKECMPQFHLRNIGRAERLADPDEDLELSHEDVEYGLRAPGALPATMGTYQAPPLIEESNLDFVKKHQFRMHKLIRKTAWQRHFCQELKESVRGPLWRYDPDAASAEEQ